MSAFRRSLFVAAILIVSTSTALAGRWQLRRLHARRASNATLSAARQRPPIVLPAELNAGPIDSGRLIEAHGRFDAAQQVILRGRVQDESPGLQVVTPFLLDSSDAVLWVLRGFVRSPDAVTPPEPIPAPVGDAVTIRGLALAIPITSDSGAPLVHNGSISWKRMDRDELARRRTGSLAVYLVLTGDSTGPGRLATVPPPEWTDGPHLSYAIQWFGMTIAVLVFGLIVLLRSGREPAPPPGAP